tara:strand:+ start:502 stop:1308 length:807 start_codon:yes stop_codon:yes gene_type:complete
MRYTKYSTRNLEEQDAYMWDAADFDLLINNFIPNRTITHLFPKYLKDDAHILEGGCGNGSWVKYLNDKGYNCIGTDINDVILETAKKEKLNIMKDDILNMSFDDNTFDAYLSLGVIEHWKEGPQKAIKEAYRVIKPGGYFFVSTPCNHLIRKLFNHPLRDMVNLFFKILGKKLYFVEYRFERHELRQFMIDGGFDVVESLPNDYRLDSNEYSFGMYTDWPWLRDRKVKYRLNFLGRITKAILKSINPFWAVSGIMVVAQKPLSQDLQN